MKIKIIIQRETEKESNITFLRTLYKIKAFVSAMSLKSFLWSLGITYDLIIEGNDKKVIFIEDITKTVYRGENVSEEEANSETRKREVVQARQISMYFAKQLTKNSLATIGKKIGDKDHATVMHACRTINNLIDTDKRFRDKIDEYDRLLSFKGR